MSTPVVAAYVTTWEKVKEGDAILWGGVPAWVTVTGIQARDGSRFLITSSPHDPDARREYWARDETLVTVRAVQENGDN